MDSSIISHLPPSTAASLALSTDPNQAVDNQAEAAGDGEETMKYDEVISFVALLEKHGCLKRCDRQYMLSLTASESWERLFEYTQFVGSLEFNRDAVLEAAQIYPSVFVYIAQQLKGKSLFPNLSSIHLEGLDTSSHYLPLLSSGCLKDMTLNFVLGTPFLEFTTYAFLANLVSTSPGLQSLKLQNVAGMASQMLNVIVKFQHLHTLEITRFTDVENFEQLRLLGTLASLENLSLTVEHSAYTRSTQPVSSNLFLPSLKRLSIEASSNVVLDFILCITSDHLKALTFRHISTRAAEPQQLISKPSRKPARSIFGTPLGSTTADIVKEKANFLDSLSSRWPQHLKEVAITSSSNLECDLHDIARLQALRSLQFKGPSLIGVQETFGGLSGFRNSLRCLHLSQYHVSLSLLNTIALSTPFLREMTISIDIGERPAAPSISAIIHPLQSLTIDGPRSNKGNTMFGEDRDYEINLSQLIFMARYLNAIFPNILNLKASVREHEWGKVWQLLKFCQVSRDDEKGRKSIGKLLM